MISRVSGSLDGTEMLGREVVLVHGLSVASVRLNLNTFRMLPAVVKKGDGRNPRDIFNANPPTGRRGAKVYEWNLEISYTAREA